MNFSVANQSCFIKDVENIELRFEQKSLLNNSDKIHSKNIIDDELTLASHQQYNDYLQKETESCKIVADIWHSFKDFQKSILDVRQKCILLKCAYNDHTAIVGSPSSFTFLTNTTPKPIPPISESPTASSNFIASKTACSSTTNLGNLAIQTKLNSVYNDHTAIVGSQSSFTFLTNTTPKLILPISESPTSSSSLIASKTTCLSTANLGNLAIQTKLNSASTSSSSSSLPTLILSKLGVSGCQKDCKSLRESPSTKSSNSILTYTKETVPSVNIVDSNMLPGTPNTTIHDRIEHHDKDVKEADNLSTQTFLPTTEPLIYGTTSGPKFEKFSNLELDNLNEDDYWEIYDFEEYLRAFPYFSQVTGSRESLVNTSSSPEYKKDRTLEEDETHNLENPMQVTAIITNQDCKKCITNTLN